MKFQDHFSKHASDYARFRPTYPTALFAHLASLAPSNELAWDCATGNGQAALELAEHFKQVVATDASAPQIENAGPHERVRYEVMPAEGVPSLHDRSVDLITVAQALHWFDLEKFYAEVRRVLKPGGVLAAWCYVDCSVSPEIDQLVHDYARGTVENYWPPERERIWNKYADIPFPFEELPMPPFRMEVEWSRDAFLGYLWSWSSTQRYVQAHGGKNPLEELTSRLDWEGTRKVTWDLYFKVGRAALIPHFISENIH